MNRPEFLESRLIPVNEFSRSGILRDKTLSIDLHWTEVPGAPVDNIVKYFHDLQFQDPNDNEVDTYTGANIVVGPDTAIEIIPVNEVSYTAAADGKKRTYTQDAKKLFGAKYTKYWPKSYQPYQGKMLALSPNYLTCSIEIVHPSWTGEFEVATLDRLRILLVWLLERYKLRSNRIIRHYDITRKHCPKYWVDNPDEYAEYLKSVDAAWKLQ